MFFIFVLMKVSLMPQDICEAVLKMEPDPEDPENSDNMVPWSGSDGSQELCVAESLAESYNEDDVSDPEYPLEPQPPHIPKSDTESPEHLQTQDWESANEQHSLGDLSGSEENVSYQEEDDIYLNESEASITESPNIQNSPTSLSPHPCPDSEPPGGQMPQPHSPSSLSSAGCAHDMTLALTLTTEQQLEASYRQGPGTGNMRVESSEEGGSSEAPPASVYFGISDEGAEQAEKWNSESDTDLCRPERYRARYTRLGHNESERHVKETKSKCKRIARLLTDAPNPQNKGALLFKKRRQRVKKYTLVSYGTGVNKLDSEDQIEEESELKPAGYNFVATSDSELEEEYSVYHQQHKLSLNWSSGREMEALPETKGKGVLMFAQRRKRIDEIVSEHEELRSKGLLVEVLSEAECMQAHDTKEMYRNTDQVNYMDGSLKQHKEYQKNIQQMDHLSNMPRPLVPNRTAKPFLGFQDVTTAPVMPGGLVPVSKKHEPTFKVPVPTITNPQVWSPTGDIIASRDERISVPAIKTGNLPESKRKVARKQVSDPHLQNKGDRRSYIESEEDCFSLGAEACNFMQPRTLKLKNPPPVPPKPTINPSCPPWMMKSPSGEPHVPPRSPVSQPSHSSTGPHSQHYLQQQDWAQPQQMANHSTPNSVASCPPQAGKSYIYTSKALQASPKGRVLDRSINRAGDGPTMAGKGAELFAKRRSRMEKFVVDADTVQANKTRSTSPPSSLPNSWRYSSGVRGPPPLSYNPLLAPPSAAKQTPSPKIKPKTKEKPKAAPKHQNALDIMKHQPYQLDSTLFKYDAVPETKTFTSKPTPLAVQGKAEHLDEKRTVTGAHHLTNRQAPSTQYASTSSRQSSIGDSIASAFSPASLIARGARQMAPRPRFSAKKPLVAGKQWRPVAMIH
uniref:Synaptopodin 2b n=1 Tax=Mastacembelus armatus TaxID=205130 RepID=A0A7N8Y8A7_9TELE